MTKSHETSELSNPLEIISTIQSARYRSTREGQIAMGRAAGAQLVVISEAGVLGGSLESIRPITRESDPKLVRPFKRWLRRNGLKDHSAESGV